MLILNEEKHSGGKIMLKHLPGICVLLLSIMSNAAWAKIINVEFNFTPFVGDVKQSEVEMVPGKARVFLNNTPVAEVDVEQKKVPVLFEAREVAPAVWVNATTFGSLVIQGKNLLRIEFEPKDANAAYQARFQWADISDQVTKEETAGGFSSTNRAAQGMDTKQAKGKVVVESPFQGDFAVDQAWHHYPAISAVSDDDKQQVLAQLKARTTAFKPKFEGIYKILEKNPQLIVSDIRKLKCLDKAYATGARISLENEADIEFTTSGGPAVVVSGKKGQLYRGDAKKFSKLKGDAGFCAAVALTVAYPPRMVLVKTPAGKWEQIY